MSEWIGRLRKALDAEYGDRPRVGVIATVDRHGAPHARSVVCRRIEDDGSLWIASDARSGKNMHVRHESRAELAFWLPGLRQQYRVAGVVSVLCATDDDPRRPELWRELSDSARALFAWPPTGRPREEPPDAFPRAVPAEVEPPDEFEVLVIDPERVDHLDLNGHPHRRRRWYGDGEWVEEEINP